MAEAPRWPGEELRAIQVGGGWYRGAAYCRRGHPEETGLSPQDWGVAATSCPICGAPVISACPNCGLRIRGKFQKPNTMVAQIDRPDFCDECGSAFPWASRQARIYELENLLDQEEIDEADRVVVMDHLRRLREEDGLGEKDEQATWRVISARAGKALRSERVKNVLEGLISAGIRSQIGL